MRAKIITSLSATAQPGAAVLRLSGRAHRWAAWARALAGRFRAGRLRGVGAALLLQHRTRPQSAGPMERTVERIVERTRVGTTLFAPRLHLRLHLAVAPLVRGSGWPGTPSVPRSTVLTGSAAGPEAKPGATRTAGRNGRNGRNVRALARSVPPLERARARSGAAALPPGLALTLARARRAGLPRASSGEALALAGRIATRGQRREAPLKRPAPALHRPAPPTPPSEAVSEASARPRRRVSAGNSAPGTAFPVGAPGVFTGTPGELDRLTEQVVRRIDRRMDAWRERTGRVR